jgi:ABC-type bacteriocin/lantibiotic exporter with double-glycine peptidase domain
LQNQKINNGISNAYIKYLKTQTNFVIKSEISFALQNNYHEFQKIYVDQTKFTSAIEFLETGCANLLYIVLVMTGCYLIVDSQSINLGQLTFLISLSAMMSNAFNGICGFVIKRIEYQQMVEIYQNFISIDNVAAQGNLNIGKITGIKLIGDKKTTCLTSGLKLSRFAHHYIDTITLKSENSHKQLFINDINVKELDYHNYMASIFTFNSDTKISPK